MSDLSDNRHHFEVTVSIRGTRSDYSSDTCTVVERAHNLKDALGQASARPLGDWFATDPVDELAEAHHHECLLCGRPLQARRWWQLPKLPWCPDKAACERACSQRPSSLVCS